MAKKNNNVPGGLSDKASDIILILITGIVLFLVAYPLYYVLVASLLCLPIRPSSPAT